MKLSTRTSTLAAAIALAIPSVALAQDNVSAQANDVAETAQQLEQEANTLSNVVEDDLTIGDEIAGGGDEDRGDRHDKDFPWGLLGLLGLAGLLGLKGRDHDRHDHDHGRTTATADRPGSTTDRRL